MQAEHEGALWPRCLKDAPASLPILIGDHTKSEKT
ncbi:hypothetical protein X768_14530 [Mesorhizobium sp. LSJC265A00]|nr:hypothetical protein X768_14530 [Mesorhizobium sp. LSJC265A00]